MRVHLGAQGILGPVALTIGNFDGVHRGHGAMLSRLKAAADRLQIASAVMSFEPHPREFFRPQDCPARLTNLREKADRLALWGVDHFLVCRFNHMFSAQTAEQFMSQWLQSTLHVRWLLTGDDFRFGANRQGDVSTLKAFGQAHGIEVETQDTVVDGEDRISSSLIRACLQAGQLQRAGSLLGAPWSMQGRVIRGDGVGRQWGFPTANIDCSNRCLPVTGIFAVRARLSSGAQYFGVASLGTRPTVKSAGQQLLEVYLLDFSGDLYGQRMQLEFLEKFRDEQRFDSVEALKEQIGKDVEEARRFFKDDKTVIGIPHE